MRILLPLRRRDQGSILMVSLWTMLIIGIALLTYLQLSKNQNHLVFRSQVWNAAMPMAEAGIEEALAHSSLNCSNWLSSGWSLSASNTIYTSNTLGDGWYQVVIATNAVSSNFVTITSTGGYPIPGTTTYATRCVRATAFKMPVYRFALYGKSGVHFNGNGVRIDSYDSRDSTKSTFGLYDAAKAGAKGDIGTYNGSPGATYDLGNGNVWGHIYMGANGKVTVGPGGKAGSVAWQTGSGNSGIQPGWFRTDLNVPITDASVPFSGGVPPLTNIKIDGTIYDYVFTSGLYQMPTLTGKAIVTGDALIYVTGDVNCNVFRVLTNTSAILYGGGAVRFSDTDNQSRRASNFQVLGLKTCKSVDLDNEFMGSVYAPYASVTLSGNRQVYGSIAADTVTLKGGSDVHYDEALADPKGRTDGFVILSWTEL